MKPYKTILLSLLILPLPLLLGSCEKEEEIENTRWVLVWSDEIARRKLETIAAALNEGWKPDWNNTDQYKY